VHAFSPGRYALSHHQSHTHVKHLPDGRMILNAEDFYAALVTASKRYFDNLAVDAALQKEFQTRADEDETGILTIATFTDIQ
jgi:hypothetical protein